MLRCRRCCAADAAPCLLHGFFFSAAMPLFFSSCCAIYADIAMSARDAPSPPLIRHLLRRFAADAASLRHVMPSSFIHHHVAFFFIIYYLPPCHIISLCHHAAAMMPAAYFDYCPSSSPIFAATRFDASAYAAFDVSRFCCQPLSARCHRRARRAAFSAESAQPLFARRFFAYAIRRFRLRRHVAASAAEIAPCVSAPRALTPSAFAMPLLMPLAFAFRQPPAFFLFFAYAADSLIFLAAAHCLYAATR